MPTFFQQSPSQLFASAIAAAMVFMGGCDSPVIGSLPSNSHAEQEVAPYAASQLSLMQWGDEGPDGLLTATVFETELGLEGETGLPATNKKAKAKGRKWITHVVIPGEYAGEISARYGVTKSALIRWNKLNKKNPRLQVGQTLKVYARYVPPDRELVNYVVKKGDSWNRIARRHGIDRKRLQRWNLRVGKNGLRPGTRLRIWKEVDEADPKRQLAAKRAGAKRSVSPDSKLPLARIALGAEGVGRPSRGRLSRGAQLPKNEKLYVLSKPDKSYGTTHTLTQTQLAIARFRDKTAFPRQIVIGAISLKHGGRFRPHRSHQTGRDIDIRLPLTTGVKAGTWPKSASEVDWDATWALLHEFVKTGEVEYIFLSYSRQRNLYRAAMRAGMSKKQLEKLIEHPNRRKRSGATIRHSDGHTAHFHVRFKCSASETRCES